MQTRTWFEPFLNMEPPRATLEDPIAPQERPIPTQEGPKNAPRAPKSKSATPKIAPLVRQQVQEHLRDIFPNTSDAESTPKSESRPFKVMVN